MNEPFRRYNLEKKTDTFTCRLNDEERKLFNLAKNRIEQPKDSTAMKQLAWIGIKKVLHDPAAAYMIETLFKNRSKNERLGITEFED